MSFEEAREQLRLSDNFSKEELKKAYRTLAKKYHPDNYTNKSEYEQKQAEEEMKKINEAYAILCDNTKFRKTEQQSYNSKIDEYISYLSKYKSKKHIYFIEGESKEICDIIDSGVADMINSAKSSGEDSPRIFLIFELIKKKIKDAFDKLKNRMYSVYSIPKNFVCQLDYECSLDDFYDQLQKFGEKFNKMKSDFNKRLDDEIFQYTLYNINEMRKEEAIFVSKYHAKDRAFQESYQNLDKIIADMHKEIKKAFEEINRVECKIRALESEIANIQNEELKNKLSKIKKDYEDGESLVDIVNLINELEELVKKDIFRNIHSIVLNNYIKGTQHYLFDPEKMKSARILLDLFLKNYESCLKGEFDISQIANFLDLTFDNPEQWINEVYSGNGNANDKDNFSHIYVSNSGNNKFRIGKVLDIKDDTVVMFVLNEFLTWVVIEVSKEKLKNDFITLEEFLAKSEFIGKAVDSYFTVLYQNNYVGILYRRGDGGITFLSPESIYFNTQDRRTLKYQDKEVMKSEIIEYINIAQKKYEEKQSKKR